MVDPETNITLGFRQILGIRACAHAAFLRFFYIIWRCGPKRMKNMRTLRLFSWLSGRYPISLSEQTKILATLFGGRPADPMMKNIVLNVRMPRIIGAVLLGSALSASGTGYQGAGDSGDGLSVWFYGRWYCVSCRAICFRKEGSNPVFADRVLMINEGRKYKEGSAVTLEDTQLVNGLYGIETETNSETRMQNYINAAGRGEGESMEKPKHLEMPFETAFL